MVYDTNTLIEEETNLSAMIEAALKQNAKEDQEASDNTEDMIVDDADLSIEDLEKTLEDKDYGDFNDWLDEETEADEELLKSLSED